MPWIRFPWGNLQQFPSVRYPKTSILLRFCLVWYCLQLVVTRDFFYCLQSHRRSVNDLSRAVQLTNRLLRFRADGGFVYYKRVSCLSFLVSSQSLNNNIVVCNCAGWDKNWTDFKGKGGLQAVYICRTMQPAGYVGTTKNLQILLNTPKNPYLNQTTQKILAKFSLPKKSQNQKFQYQTNSVIIPIT